MHPHVQLLLDLQKVDLQVSSLTKDLDQLPEEEQKRKRRLDQLEQAKDEAATALQRGEMTSRSLDNAARDADAHIKRLNERLNIVRNNAEYQATLFEIESVRKERDESQEEGLKLLEELDVLKERADATAAAYEEERKVFEEFLGEAEKLRAESAEEVAQARARRAKAAEPVPPDLLREYEGLYKTRDHQAVVPCEDGYCQGCYNKITINDNARLMGASMIVRCGSCQRILYIAH